VNLLFEKHRELQERRADEGFDGFTLIELLIVIVVLGILAATVIFALGGVQGQSAQAACTSDAKSVEVAVEAFHANPGNNGAWPANVAALVGNPSAGYLRTAPNNSAYAISLGSSTSATGTSDGSVWVTPTGGAAQNYDTSGCAGVS
jgi:general secretion pathway protein G